MSTNEVYKDANSVPLPVASGVKSSDLVIVGGLVGVCQTDRDADGIATVKLNGAFDLPLAATTTVGQAIYAHAAGGTAPATDGSKVGLIDVTATTGTLIGHALKAVTVASGTKPVTVRLAKA